MAGIGTARVATAASTAAPVGVHCSKGAAPPNAGQAGVAEQLEHRRDRDGDARRAPSLARPEPRATGETTTTSSAEVHETGRAPDDVGQRVECADLVEVDALDVGAVDRRLGPREPLEDVGGEGPHPRVERRGVEQRPHVAKGAGRWVGLVQR